MAKKRVEVEAGENVVLDEEAMSSPMYEIPKMYTEQSTFDSPQAPQTRPVKQEAEVKEPVNCLRNEKVKVQFVANPAAMVQDKRHILYGGMADNATRTFVVPKLSSGMYKNVLTNNEMAFLETAMGLEKGALSIYKKDNNFWNSSNPNGVGKVILKKQDNYLDLSIPEQYIQYKILLANKDYIASSIQELEERPKATYQFVIVSEDAESASNLSKMDTTMQCYTEYGAVRNDADTLRVIIELLEGRPLAPKTKLDFLQNKVNDYIQKDPRTFLRTITDELLPYKVLIRKSIEAGLISKKNDTYYLRQDGSPLCEMGEDSTLNNAAKYLSSIKHQDLKYLLEAKVKE